MTGSEALGMLLGKEIYDSVKIRLMQMIVMMLLDTSF